jgi:hypothetical protein
MANYKTVPWLVSGFFKIITPFIDPVTREKLKFNDDMKQYVPPEQLWSEDWGGEMDFEYDHSVYWPALNEMCRLRKEERLRRWEAGGKLVGESEDYLAGGTDVSVEGVEYKATGATAGAMAPAPAPTLVAEEKKEAVVDKDSELKEVEEKLAETKLEEQAVAA